MIKQFLAAVICTLSFIISFSQISPPSSDNLSVVYFVRMQPDAQWTNFDLYDSTQYIGKVGDRTYLRYECAPGKHLLWISTENNDFVKADLLSGKIYFIEIVPVLGMNKWRADMIPMHGDNEYQNQRISAFIRSKPPEEFNEAELLQEQKRQKKKINKALLRYKEDLYKGKLFSELKGDMYYKLKD